MSWCWRTPVKDLKAASGQESVENGYSHSKKMKSWMLPILLWPRETWSFFTHTFRQNTDCLITGVNSLHYNSYCIPFSSHQAYPPKKVYVKHISTDHLKISDSLINIDEAKPFNWCRSQPCHSPPPLLTDVHCSFLLLYLTKLRQTTINNLFQPGEISSFLLSTGLLVLGQGELFHLPRSDVRKHLMIAFSWTRYNHCLGDLKAEDLKIQWFVGY